MKKKEFIVTLSNYNFHSLARDRSVWLERTLQTEANNYLETSGLEAEDLVVESQRLY